MKKAISPLIATILLIAIAVVLVGILMSWGQGFVQKGINTADNSIDHQCTGASISIRNCDYNMIGKTLRFNMINSGEITFKPGSSFNVLLIDSNDTLENDHLSVLNSLGLTTGEAATVTITDYEGVPPIRVEVRNTQCTGYFWPTTCK
jgi:flagellin-like protein